MTQQTRGSDVSVARLRSAAFLTACATRGLLTDRAIADAVGVCVEDLNLMRLGLRAPTTADVARIMVLFGDTHRFDDLFQVEPASYFLSSPRPADSK
jgi:hypothetical protein